MTMLNPGFEGESSHCGYMLTARK